MNAKTSNQIAEELREELDDANLGPTTRRIVAGLIIDLCRAVMNETADKALGAFEAELAKRA